MTSSSTSADSNSATADTSSTSVMSKTTRRSARSRLLDAAATLFYADGMTATGIDKITAEAGVARKSLYNNFASKDELMLVYIERRHEEWLELYQRRLEAIGTRVASHTAEASASGIGSSSTTELSSISEVTGVATAEKDGKAVTLLGGKSGVFAIFDAYLDHAEAAYPHGFRGCGLLNAAAELPAGTPGREAVRRHKEEVESLLVAHLKEAGTPDPHGMAEHLSFLLEGAMSRAGLEGQPDRILHARKLAESLMESTTEESR